MVTLEHVKPGPKPHRFSSRNDFIFYLWLRKHDVMSLREIGELYGLTRGRIWQIVNRRRQQVAAAPPPPDLVQTPS